MLKLLTLVVLSSLRTSLAYGRTRFRSMSVRNVRGRQLVRFRGSRRWAGLEMQGPEEQLEEWKDHNKKIASHLSDDHLLELASGITTDVYSKELHGIADQFPSRFVTNRGNANAAEYIKQQFSAMGLNISEQTVEDERIKEQYLNLMSSEDDKDLNQAKHTNIIGYLKGGDLAHEVILLGAHYDSVNWENTGGSAPGVDDNGSGTALVLSVARVLAGLGKNFRPRRSVIFVAFNAEEEGLVGSEHFAKMYRNDGQEKFGDLKAVFIADEVAWPGSGQDRRQAIFETKGEGDETNAMVDTLAKLSMLKNKTSAIHGDGIGDDSHHFVVNYHGFGSDHMSFLNEGIPAVLLIERDDDFHAKEWGHSSRDTFEHVDLSYGAAMTRLALRAVAAFANPAP